MNSANRKIASAPVLIIAGLLALELAASAATYNFIFNNTEQGANSTANPSLNVAGDGTVTKSGGNADGKPLINSQGLVQTPNGETPVSSAAVPAASAETVPEFRHFRLMGSAADYQANFESMSSFKWSASLAYFFNREWGLNVFGLLDPSAGSWQLQAGAELEVIPIRIAIGRIENLIELGFMGGVSHAQDWNDPHLGARLNVNLGESWGLTATGRAARDYAMAEAGLALHF